RTPGVRGEREAFPVRRPCACGDRVLHLRQVRELLRPPTTGGYAVELVELVAVTVGDEQNGAVAADGDRAHGVLRKGRELVGPPTVDPRRPEIELARDVRHEENALAVRSQLGDRLEAAEREKLLERNRFAHASKPTTPVSII